MVRYRRPQVALRTVQCLVAAWAEQEEGRRFVVGGHFAVVVELVAGVGRAAVAAT